jgi:hypothetical protein
MKMKYRNKIISTLIVITTSLLLICEIGTGVSFASVIENGNQTNSTSASVPTTQVFHYYSIPPPSLNITYPSYPPTVTTGKIIIQGTANDSKSGIRGVSASAHVFPFNGNFTVNLASSPSPIRPNNWSHWSVPLIINTTGTYRIVISASNNAGNTSYAETTINAALPAKTPQAVTSNTEHQSPKIAFVRPTFTEAAYQPHGFYTFYFKYKFPPFGKNITTDLDMLTVKTPVSVAEFQNVTGLKHLSNFTALIPTYDPDLQKFWIPLTNTVKKDVPTATVTVMRDEDVNDGHIFNADNNKSNAYDLLLLFHNEYVTQSEYNNLKQFVNNGGKIVFIDGDVLYAQVRYDKQNHTISLVKGHDWQFDGKVARRSVPERWYNETKEWVGGNFLVNDIHNNVTFANNPFNYTHFEEQFVNNPNDKILLNYEIKLPKDYLQYNVFPPDKQNGNITVATYALDYGAGRVIMLGIYGQNLVNNKSFINFFDNLVKHVALCYKLEPCNSNQPHSTTIGVQDNKGNVNLNRFLPPMQ